MRTEQFPGCLEDYWIDTLNILIWLTGSVSGYEKKGESMYENLTKYIPKIQGDFFGEWVKDTQNDGTARQPMQMPYMNYSESVNSFRKDFYQFLTDHTDVNLSDYQKILEENGITWDFDSMNNANVSSLGEFCVLALILGAIRTDRFSEGALLHFLESGAIVRWLERLKAIDEVL